MKVKFIQVIGSWREVVDAARTTVGKEEQGKEPSASWKRRILLAEHSPIRHLIVKWKWTDLKYWVSVHIVRHKIGIEHFVSTQRTDRTGVNRDLSRQSALVTHECVANAQALINISRKRLCNQASAETREAWGAVVDALRAKEPELAAACVPECVYRGFCPEMNPCGYSQTDSFSRRMAEYRAMAQPVPAKTG